ncbi:MAG: hypothetical protein BAJALOKI3v1_50119 [Promethearchaeota archaeon]|nr:MAG: hypothetical protein BAJALOKI3v1_50119 [Candidatus Lokiarchaeota archaeon]
MIFNINTATWDYQLPYFNSNKNIWDDYDVISSIEAEKACKLVIEQNINPIAVSGWEKYIQRLSLYSSRTYSSPSTLREYPRYVKDTNTSGYVDLDSKSVYAGSLLDECVFGKIALYLQSNRSNSLFVTGSVNTSFNSHRISTSQKWFIKNDTWNPIVPYNSGNTLKYNYSSSDGTYGYIDQYLDDTFIQRSYGYINGSYAEFDFASGVSVYTTSYNVTSYDGKTAEIPTYLTIKGLFRTKPIEKCGNCTNGFIFESGITCADCFGYGYFGLNEDETEYIPFTSGYIVTFDNDNNTYIDQELNSQYGDGEAYWDIEFPSGISMRGTIKRPNQINARIEVNRGLLDYSTLSGVYQLVYDNRNNLQPGILDCGWSDWVGSGSHNYMSENSPVLFQYPSGDFSASGWPESVIGYTPISYKHIQPFTNMTTYAYTVTYHDQTESDIEHLKVYDLINSVRSGQEISWRYDLNNNSGDVINWKILSRPNLGGTDIFGNFALGCSTAERSSEPSGIKYTNIDSISSTRRNNYSISSQGRYILGNDGQLYKNLKNGFGDQKVVMDETYNFSTISDDKIFSLPAGIDSDEIKLFYYEDSPYTSGTILGSIYCSGINDVMSLGDYIDGLMVSNIYGSGYLSQIGSEVFCTGRNNNTWFTSLGHTFLSNDNDDLLFHASGSCNQLDTNTSNNFTYTNTIADYGYSPYLGIGSRPNEVYNFFYHPSGDKLLGIADDGLYNIDFHNHDTKLYSWQNFNTLLDCPANSGTTLIRYLSGFWYNDKINIVLEGNGHTNWFQVDLTNNTANISGVSNPTSVSDVRSIKYIPAVNYYLINKTDNKYYIYNDSMSDVTSNIYDVDGDRNSYLFNNRIFFIDESLYGYSSVRLVGNDVDNITTKETSISSVDYVQKELPKVTLGAKLPHDGPIGFFRQCSSNGPKPPFYSNYYSYITDEDYICTRTSVGNHLVSKRYIPDAENIVKDLVHIGKSHKNLLAFVENQKYYDATESTVTKNRRVFYNLSSTDFPEYIVYCSGHSDLIHILQDDGLNSVTTLGYNVVYTDQTVAGPSVYYDNVSGFIAYYSSGPIDDHNQIYDKQRHISNSSYSLVNGYGIDSVSGVNNQYIRININSGVLDLNTSDTFGEIIGSVERQDSSRRSLNGYSGLNNMGMLPINGSGDETLYKLNNINPYDVRSSQQLAHWPNIPSGEQWVYTPFNSGLYTLQINNDDVHCNHNFHHTLNINNVVGIDQDYIWSVSGSNQLVPYNPQNGQVDSLNIIDLSGESGVIKRLFACDHIKPPLLNEKILHDLSDGVNYPSEEDYDYAIFNTAKKTYSLFNSAADDQPNSFRYVQTYRGDNYFSRDPVNTFNISGSHVVFSGSLPAEINDYPTMERNTVWRNLGDNSVVYYHAKSSSDFDDTNSSGIYYFAAIEHSGGNNYHLIDSYTSTYYDNYDESYSNGNVFNEKRNYSGTRFYTNTEKLYNNDGRFIIPIQDDVSGYTIRYASSGTPSYENDWNTEADAVFGFGILTYNSYEKEFSLVIDRSTSISSITNPGSFTVPSGLTSSNGDDYLNPRSEVTYSKVGLRNDYDAIFDITGNFLFSNVLACFDSEKSCYSENSKLESYYTYISGIETGNDTVCDVTVKTIDGETVFNHQFSSGTANYNPIDIDTRQSLFTGFLFAKLASSGNLVLYPSFKYNDNLYYTNDLKGSNRIIPIALDNESFNYTQGVFTSDNHKMLYKINPIKSAGFVFTDRNGF